MKRGSESLIEISRGWSIMNPGGRKLLKKRNVFIRVATVIMG